MRHRSETAKQLLPTELTSNKAFYPEPEAMQQMEHYEYLGKMPLNSTTIFSRMEVGIIK